MKKTLLLINGGQIILDFNKRILERAGYSVKCAVGHDGAWEQLAEHTPDGIILASDLPDGTGFDLLKELMDKKDIPIMFISNNRDDEVKALNLGSSDFLKKPYDYDVMLARVDLMLERIERERMTQTKELNIGSYERKGKNIQSRQRKTTKDGDGPAPQEKKNSLDRRFTPAVLAACLVLFVAAGILIHSFIGGGSQFVDIPESRTPLAGYQPPPGQTGAPRVEIPGIENITIPADTRDVSIRLFNPENNVFDFVFELILMDTSEVLFTSEKVPPGTSFEDISLTRSLTRGEYDAVLKIQTYTPAENTSAGIIRVDFRLTAE